jgi:6-phosphogluconolactonase
MKQNVYFGTYANNIFYGEFDSETGDLKITGKSPEIENPSYLYFSENKNILYAVSEKQDGEAVSLDLQENKITSVQKTNGAHPCHLCVNKNLLLVANYSGGTLSIFNLENEGRIKESNKSIANYGKSITGRQEKSHVHYVKNIAGESFALCDLGLDKIFIYHSFYDIIELECPAGSGPRHFAYDNKIIYANRLEILYNIL